MNVRMIPMIVLAAALGLAGCQEEEAEGVGGEEVGEVEEAED